MRLKVAILTFALLSWLVVPSRASDDGKQEDRRPLHQSIDQLIEAGLPNFAV